MAEDDQRGGAERDIHPGVLPAAPAPGEPAGVFGSSSGPLDWKLRVERDGFARLRLELQSQRLHKQVEDGTSVLEKNPHPFPPLHLRKVNPPECQTAEQMDEAVGVRPRFQPSDGGGNRFGTVRRCPCLSKLG